jgi:SAM-dependent methyltransferase
MNTRTRRLSAESRRIFNQNKLAIQESDILDFFVQNKFPYDTRVFFIQHLMPYVGFYPWCKGKRVLEIGVGDGFGCYFLSQAASVVGVDFEYSRWISLRKYSTAGRRPMHFVNANALALPFPAGSFDRVVTCQVIEHIPAGHLDQFLSEIKRVLTPEGIALIVTLNVQHNVKDQKTYEKFHEHDKEFSRDEFQVLLRKHFPTVAVLGLGVSFLHRFMRRLKKWGFMKYGFLGKNPVQSFYKAVLPRHYSFTRHVSRGSIDLVGICAMEQAKL